ncbi:3'-5' exonuclease [Halopseudomonas pelagia]|uniref:3'-5' exonuclease n=1 Tax=Halopseudomonas pelagia TaxID=553151 RepID=UPI00039CE380|nr:3'-5' exonuclease [Halopseudomonas pelagia]|tara:strand:- start:121 stop:798 length:678 start_codon:yes stop_codon:yes gene_type:complete
MTALLNYATLPSLPAYNALQQSVIDQARSWILHDGLVLDCETCGLGEAAEIIEIAIMTMGGVLLFNSLIKPSLPIPEEATAVHGITDDMVANAPSWPEVHDQIWQLIKGRPVLAYGAAFDFGRIDVMAHLYGLESPTVSSHTASRIALSNGTSWMCVMQAYAQLWQEPTACAQSADGWRWKALTEACRAQGIPVGRAHRALDDCLMTQALVNAMAGEPVTRANTF